MEKRRARLVLVVCATVCAAIGVAHGDEPGPTATTPTTPSTTQPAPAHARHHARKKKKSHKPPEASDACTTDDDCALTAYRDGACCPTLCQKRAVSKTSAEAIEKFAATCQNERKCPLVDCAAPPTAREPACVSGKCVARAARSPARE